MWNVLVSCTNSSSISKRFTSTFGCMIGFIDKDDPHSCSQRSDDNYDRLDINNFERTCLEPFGRWKRKLLSDSSLTSGTASHLTTTLTRIVISHLNLRNLFLIMLHSCKHNSIRLLTGTSNSLRWTMLTKLSLSLLSLESYLLLTVAYSNSKKIIVRWRYQLSSENIWSLQKFIVDISFGDLKNLNYSGATLFNSLPTEP